MISLQFAAHYHVHQQEDDAMMAGTEEDPGLLVTLEHGLLAVVRSGFPSINAGGDDAVEGRVDSTICQLASSIDLPGHHHMFPSRCLINLHLHVLISIHCGCLGGSSGGVGGGLLLLGRTTVDYFIGKEVDFVGGDVVVAIERGIEA